MQPFAPLFAEGAKSVQGECYLSRRLRVKFRPSRFRFAGVISAKSHFVRSQYTPSSYKKICFRRRRGLRLAAVLCDSATKRF